MALPDYTADRYISRKKGNRLFKLAFFLVILAGIGAGSWYIYQNIPRYLFNFNENKYAEIEKRLSQAEQSVSQLTTDENNPSKYFLAALKHRDTLVFLDLAQKLTKDHPEDPMIFYYRGMLYNRIFDTACERQKHLYTDIFFYEFTDHYRFPVSLDHDVWSKAILFLRKALALGLPEPLARKTNTDLARLYLWGGRPYWSTMGEWLEKNRDAGGNTLSLFNIILVRQTPDWKALETQFSPDVINFWKGLYYLKTGNSPLGYTHLSGITRSKAEVRIKNNAWYILGFLQGRDKKRREQLYSYKQIDTAEFFSRAPWFVTEYHYVLRFLGEQKEADRLMFEFEKFQRLEAEKEKNQSK